MTLEERIELLTAIIERERAERRDEALVAAAKIRVLEDKINQLTAANQRRSAPQRQAREDEIRSSVKDIFHIEPQRFSQRWQRKQEQSHESAEAENPSVSAESTAARQAWDKFCAVARHQFTVRELSLVSLETLRKLLEHFEISDPVECARIQHHWTLLQDSSVPNVSSDRASASKAQALLLMKPTRFEPLRHDKDFDTRMTPGSPSLSKRQLLSPDAPRQSDPNSTLERHAETPLKASKGSLRVDPFLGCNPNRTLSSEYSRRGIKTFDQTIATAKPTGNHGKRRTASAEPKPLTPFPQSSDVRAHGLRRITRSEAPEVRPGGLRIGFSPAREKITAQSIRCSARSGGGPVNFTL